MAIEQVLINLIRNAVESVSIREPDSREICLQVSAHDKRCAKIAVSDNGKGIDPQYLSRIFDPFFTSKPDGLGLGLAIVRSLVEAHGGEIKARSNAGPGATIEFTIPRADRT